MNSKILVKLSHYFYSLAKSEELPKDSNNLTTILNNIDKLETYQAKEKYAEKNLERLSSGSSRIVFLTPQKTVVKLAKNDRGIAQNKAESNPKMKSKYLNKVLNKSKDFNWIETNYLDKITAKDFKELTGLDFDDFGEAIRYGLKSVSGSSKNLPKNFDEVSSSDLFKEFKRLGKQFNLMPGDLARISSWGVKDKTPILIDAGLTKEIFDKYYDSKNNSSSSS